MRISIAMTTFNGDLYLREQLQSILQQDVKPFELIICDDNSNDGTFDILENFAENSTFTTHIFRNQKNIGSTKNFEKAIKICNGDVIALADQDDIWRRDKLGKISAIFSKNTRCVAVFSDARLVDHNGKNLGPTLWESVGVTRRIRENLANGGDIAFRTLMKKNYITGTTFAFRADMRKHVIPIPFTWIHDAWIAQLLTALGPIHNISETLVDYRQHYANQIGIKKKKLSEKLYNIAILEDSMINVECLYKYLIDKERNWPNYVTYHASRKHKHLKNRVMAGHTIIPLIEEIINGNYMKYSNGIRSIFKDIFNYFSG